MALVLADESLNQFGRQGVSSDLTFPDTYRHPLLLTGSSGCPLGLMSILVQMYCIVKLENVMPQISICLKAGA